MERKSISSMDDVEANIRKLRYRLKRQGVLELDTWLSHLEPVVENHDEILFRSIASTLACSFVHAESLVGRP